MTSNGWTPEDRGLLKGMCIADDGPLPESAASRVDLHESLQMERLKSAELCRQCHALWAACGTLLLGAIVLAWECLRSK